MTADSIARLKITLDDVKPQVLRRIEVPFTSGSTACIWRSRPRWAGPTAPLRNPRPRRRMGHADPDWGDGPLDARKAKLADVLEDVGIKTLRYLYDFGDGWEHTIKIERLVDPNLAPSIRASSKPKGVARPKTSAAPGATPNSWRPSAIQSTSATPK